MDGVKIIDISSMNDSKSKSKKLTKKQMYKEILSSSKNVKEIINNRKKTCRFNYLNTLPKLQPLSNNLQSKSFEKKTNVVEKKESKYNKKSNETSNIVEHIKKYPVKEQQLKLQKEEIAKNKKQMKINSYFKIRSQENESKKRKKKSVTFSNKVKVLNVDKKTLVDKINKSRNIETKQIKLNRQSKKFTEKQVVELINILLKLNKLEQYNKIHKTIRRINKLQINQMLFALRLIKKYSNAPENMLKNTLFNYVTGSIKIVRD